MNRKKVRDGVIGHAIGDAMGVPIEFMNREFLLEHPVTRMLDDYVPSGSWSDDTSMEIATIDSFIQNKEFNYKDIMEKWTEWLNDAKYTPYDNVLDVGRTCLHAIKKFNSGVVPLECGPNDMMSNGNGSLMRILPVAYYCYYKKLKTKEIYELVKNVSSLTHSHEISILGCYIYVNYVIFLLEGKDKFASYNMLKMVDYSMFSESSLNIYSRILKDDLKKLNVDDIKSSGYVVDTLEASIWVVLNARDYKETIIGAINLGGDTDTIGAIAGSMAGIIYGYDSFPKEWLDKISKKDYLEDLCEKFESALVENK